MHIRVSAISARGGNAAFCGNVEAMGMTVIAVVLGLAVLLLPWIAILRVARVERRLREAEARIARLFTELSALRGTPRGAGSRGAAS